MIQAAILVPAHPPRLVSGRTIHIMEPISFWGGVSPLTGVITDARSNQHGRSIANSVLLIRQLRGSSSASSILLELIYKKLAPSALILDCPDAILALGALVAAEMDLVTPPILRLSSSEQDGALSAAEITIDESGKLLWN